MTKKKPATASNTISHKEPWTEQAASFIGFFIYLLVLKSFFLPLFIIPTGSEASTLLGQHAVNACPNCGIEYAVNWSPPGPGGHPDSVQCPNCRWRQYSKPARGLAPDEILTHKLRPSAGDRIFVHGWNFAKPWRDMDGFGPQRWDTIVFKVPRDGQTNYIKRLIGLPNEKIELIDGDLFVNDQVAQKTADAQRSLWVPYYNHDYPPQRSSVRADYHPRWVALDGQGPWQGLETRATRFDGLDQPRGAIQFRTDPHDPPTRPARIEDVYGYNDPRHELQRVRDIRLSAEVDINAAGDDGYVELSMTNGQHQFFAQLYPDGRLLLQHTLDGQSQRETWSQRRLPPLDTPVRIALAHIDGTVRVEINGDPEPALSSTAEQYAFTPAAARARSNWRQSPDLCIAAEHVRATFRHLLIERDVHYTNAGRQADASGYGTQGRCIQLGPDAYFALGDNSPNSQDSRYSFARSDATAAGPHLSAATKSGEYQLGTVPGDQIIGRAFLVYWPGTLPLLSEDARPSLLSRLPLPRSRPHPLDPMTPRHHSRTATTRSSVGRAIDVTQTVLTGLILAFIFRAFMIEPFTIPTGSMATALLGAHATEVCPACGWQYDFAPQRYDNTSPGFVCPPRIICPNCQLTVEPIAEQTVPRAGDRIIVHKWLYALGGPFAPRRWDVAVFRDPAHPQLHYIKRLVGLPDETIEIIDGDLFIDGRIARKPTSVQRALWSIVFDQAHIAPEYTSSGHLPRWVAAPLPAQTSGGWSGMNTRLIHYDGLDNIPRTLSFNPDTAREYMLDLSGYNRRSSGEFVGDIRVSAALTLEAGSGNCRLEIARRPRRFYADLDTDGTVRLSAAPYDASASEALLATRKLPPLAAGRTITVEFAHVDYRVSLKINGRQLLTTTDADYYPVLEDLRRARRALPTRVRITARDLRLTLGRLRIDRDVHYTCKPRQTLRAGTGTPFQLAANEYFVLGDNSADSHDSREWHAAGPHLPADYRLGTVPANQIVGQAAFVYLPGLLPLDKSGRWFVPDLGRTRFVR